MKIDILKHFKTNLIPSGSGITKHGDSYYVIGDDSPFLFTLNKELEVTKKTPLLKVEEGFEERISKPEKPDFESLELIEEDELVIFGSGSVSPQRDIFVRVILDGEPVITSYNITKFYNQLRGLPIFEDSELNLEGSAYYDNHLYLLNRNKNLIIKFVYKELLEYLIQEDHPFPIIEITEIKLPEMKGVQAGFSGATALKSEPKIIFTASFEDTDNAYDDGEIMGSIIGVIDILNHQVSETYIYSQIPYTEERLKVESIVVKEEISSGRVKVILVSDDDLGNSIFLESVVSW